MASPIYKSTQGKELPIPFAQQFYNDHSSGDDVFLEGVLDRVWYRPTWLIGILYPLEKLGVLIAEKGEEIPTTLLVESKEDEEGHCYQIWRRRFYGKRTCKFDVKVVYDPKSRRAVDLVGLGGFLALGWDISSEGSELNINVVSAGLRVGKKFLWLPRWLWSMCLGEETFQQTALDDENIAINLVITHPVFGKVFGYKGRFHVKLQKRENSRTASL